MNATVIRHSIRARRRRRRQVWAAVAVVLLAGVGYLAWSSRTAVANIGDAAPAFRLETGDGRAVDIAPLLGRQPIVMIFYMTYG